MSSLGVDSSPVSLPAGTRVSTSWLIIAALFGIAIVWRHFTAANSDVSWLLIAGERMLDGQRLYGDILETNPPMAVLVYLPGILVGRALGVPAELVVDGLVFVAVGIALTIVARILRESPVLKGIQTGPFLFLTIAILTILPKQAFGQREHIAVIELLPALAVLAMRANGERPFVWAVVVAGIGLGLALSFKPFFAIALLVCVGSLAIQSRSWRLFFVPEYVIAAVLLALYGVFTVIFFPEYFTVVGPIVRDVYLPIGLPFGLMMEKPVVPLWGVMLIAAMLLKRRTVDTTFLALITLSVGFGIVFFMQRKGWPYHSYPMMVFAFLALDYAILSAWSQTVPHRGFLAAAVVLLIVLFAQAMVWFDHAFDGRPLQVAIARLGPHQRILVISAQAGIGHPLTRALGGIWASRQQGLLVAGYYKYLLDYGSPDPETVALVDGYANRERKALVEDFRRYQPTIVLVDRLTDDWDGWMRADPALVDEMKNYRRTDTVMDIDIYSRGID
jgi:hypothetical protein